MTHYVSDVDGRILDQLCLELVGTRHESDSARRAMLANVRELMRRRGTERLLDYLEIGLREEQELARLVSALTIHTTSWFREAPHFRVLQRYTSEWFERHRTRPLEVLSVGCSTGEEVYSVALCLAKLQASGEAGRFAVTGVDIDPVSVRVARAARYHGQGLLEIPTEYRPFLQPTQEDPSSFEPLPELAELARFHVASLAESLPFGRERFDVVLCRNVLIYFSGAAHVRAIEELIRVAAKGGLLLLGMSDDLPSCIDGVRALGQASYIKSHLRPPSGVRRASLRAYDGEGPLMSLPPGATGRLQAVAFDALLIGSSTGGVEALCQLLRELPEDFPPVLIVQHIDDHYVGDLEKLLIQASGLTLGSTLTGTSIRPGHLYVAPADRHLRIERDAAGLQARTSNAAPVAGHRPSATTLFESAFPIAHRVVACLLTGMGADGAAAMAGLKARGAHTLAQDRESSAVFGMPGKAIELGGADLVGTPWQLRQQLLHLVSKRRTPVVR